MKRQRIQQLKNFLAKDPNDSFVRFALAQEYKKQGVLKASLDEYLKLKEMDVEYLGLYYHLGKLYEELLEPKKAMLTYEEGINLAKKKADFHALSELMNVKTNLEMEMD